MVVHLLFARNHAKLATHIDLVCRLTLPALYIGETMGIFLVGVSNGTHEGLSESPPLGPSPSPSPPLGPPPPRAS